MGGWTLHTTSFKQKFSRFSGGKEKKEVENRSNLSFVPEQKMEKQKTFLFDCNLLIINALSFHFFFFYLSVCLSDNLFPIVIFCIQAGKTANLILIFTIFTMMPFCGTRLISGLATIVLSIV